jgi:hypothetical protein
MAKVKLNPITENIRGRIGDLVFKRYENEVVLSRLPDQSAQEPTEGQAQVRERFRLAAVYGRTVFADPVQKAAYEKEAKEQKKPVFSMTVADFLHAPMVDAIDLSHYTGQIGDEIIVQASDDFEVAGVGVVIRNNEGAVLEQGAATRQNGSWHYRATTAVSPETPVSIEVTATDRPGHKGVKTQARP